MATILVDGGVPFAAGGSARRAAAAVALVCAFAATASAQPLSESRRFPVERFRWSFARTGVLNSEWAEVPAVGTWDLGLWLGTADDPLVLYRTDEDGRRTTLSSLVARRTSATLVGSYSPWRRLELGVELPLILAQSRDAQAPGLGGMLDSIAGAGFGDLRLAAKLGLWRASRIGVDVAWMMAVTLPSGGGVDYRGEDGVAIAPELLISRALGANRFTANVGYRARPNVSLLNLRVTDELFGSVGGGRRVTKAVEVDVGLSFATAASSPIAQDNQDHIEALAGVSWETPSALLLSLMGGAGLQEGFGTPDWRVVLAVRFGSVRRDATSGPVVAAAAPAAPAPAAEPIAHAPPAAAPPDAPDRDGDSIADAADACPDVAEDVDGFEDEDGCADPDNDRDGVADTLDACPSQPGSADTNGCPDPDRDGDGVVDRLDNCPAEKGSVEQHGCATKQRVVLTAGKLEILDIVHFETDRDRILPDSYPLLDNVAMVLNAHAELAAIDVEGHTDNQGDDAHNKDLSQRRAAAVVRYLASRGVAAARLTAVGYGEERPVADNATKAGRAKNRRVEFRLHPAPLQKATQIDFPDETIP
jgi:outer membrane protein OmpA-like peptidoglycan-associated protein